MFIVFKPCPVSLLRGAVPVGRVMSRFAQWMPQHYGAPFDADVLERLEARMNIVVSFISFQSK